jgi:hypothetical protein
MDSWPIVVTNACADAYAAELAIPDRDTARGSLYGLIGQRGRITAELPSPVQRRGRPSGYFCLVDGMLVLPLAADREGPPSGRYRG